MHGFHHFLTYNGTGVLYFEYLFPSGNESVFLPVLDEKIGKCLGLVLIDYVLSSSKCLLVGNDNDSQCHIIAVSCT